MLAFDHIVSTHVLQAIREYDELGGPEFLSRYGFGQARSYLLIHEGRSYDSKAILGVAHKFAAGTPASSADFSGGRDGAAAVLRNLGFEVRSTDGLDNAGAPGGTPETRDQWAVAAREVLLDVARRYHAVITNKQLAHEVQERTGIHTKQLMHYWIGDVLGRVARECDRRDEPILSALCVNAEGSVGDGYAVAVAQVQGTKPSDPDDHAARERLSCHVFFGAEDVPADGGFPALTPAVAQRRERSRKLRAQEAPVLTCPTCHMALPKTGVCDNCD